MPARDLYSNAPPKRKDDYEYSQLPPKEMPKSAKMIFDEAKKLNHWIFDPKIKPGMIRMISWINMGA